MGHANAVGPTSIEGGLFRCCENAALVTDCTWARVVVAELGLSAVAGARQSAVERSGALAGACSEMVRYTGGACCGTVRYTGGCV